MADAGLVKELRARTGAGIMECKKALLESEGDIEKAIDFLRKQGTVKAAKKSGRSTSEGRIEVALGAGGERASIVEINCETDFVARNEDFQKFVSVVAEHALEQGGKDLEQFMASTTADGKTVTDLVQDRISIVGENMGVARFDVVSRENSGEKIAAYIHAGNQIGVIVKIAGEKISDDVIRDVAMHIAAMNPQYVDESQIPAAVAESEKDILRAAEDMAGKPAEVVEKMLVGRFRKFLSQICLVDQNFIKDPAGKQTVSGYLKSLDPEAKVISFLRYQVGEKVDS